MSDAATGSGFPLGHVVIAHGHLPQLECLLRAIHHSEDMIVVHLDRRLGRPAVEATTERLRDLLPHMLLRATTLWERVAGRNLHFITRSADGRFPRSLGVADLDDMIASGMFFCRKVDAARDEGLRDLLDARLRR